MLLLRCRKSSVMRTRFHARFHYAYALSGLNIATHSKLVGSFFNRNTIMGLAAPLSFLVSIRFQILFHRPSGLLLTFPSRYLFTIGRGMYLALGESPPDFIQDFTSPVLLKNINCKGITPFAYRAVTVSGRPFQAVLLGKISFLVPCLSVQANNAYVCNTPICA